MKAVLSSHAKFRVEATLRIRGRKVLIIAGEFVEGKVRVGNSVVLPDGSATGRSVRIIGIEHITASDEVEVSRRLYTKWGLVISCDDEQELAALRSLEMKGKTLDVIE